MDLLPFLLTVLAASAVLAGIIWYFLKRPHPAKKRRAKRPARSMDKIAATTRKNLTKTQTVEEAFAVGKEGLNQIKRQIKDSESQKRKRK